MSHPEQHPEPFALGGGQATKALAMLATIAEAAARLRAVNVDRRIQEEAAGRAKTGAAEQAATAAREFQREDLRAATRIFREAIKTKLSAADLEQTAKVWQTAAAHIEHGGEEHNPTAVQALELAQERMRTLAPEFMDRYDRHRVNGVAADQAVRRAVADMRTDFYQRYGGSPAARPHGGKTPLNGNAGADADDIADAIVPESFEVAVEGELRQLAVDTPMGAADRGAAAAQADAAAADRLADASRPNTGLAEARQTRGRRELAEAALEAGQNDDPRTLANETVAGLDESAVDVQAARHDRAIAKALTNTASPAATAQAAQQRAAFPNGPRRTSGGATPVAGSGAGRTNTATAKPRGRG
jgi:hypothetical protein